MPKISPCRRYHAEIQEWLRQGEPATSIGRRLGIPPQNVQHYVKRHLGGVRAIAPHGYRWVDIPKARLEAMLAIGLTHEQIAEALSVSRDTILRRVRQLGLESCRTGPRSGRGHVDWKGGRRMDKHGYIEVYVPLHPNARRIGVVFEHRLLMEVVLGRYLRPKEVVHHLDDHPRHNWPGNLERFDENADHLRRELTGREKATPRKSVPGAYGNNQKNLPCPSEHETLAQCPSEIRANLSLWIERHRPTIEHRTQSRREFLRSGAAREGSR